MLWKYEGIVEYHRREVRALRSDVLQSPAWSFRRLIPEEEYCRLVRVGGGDIGLVETAGRQLTLGLIDDLWADYLANIAELKSGLIWASWTGADPVHKFLTAERDIYEDFKECLREDVTKAIRTTKLSGGAFRLGRQEPFDRGATWTYVSTEQPFGSLADRITRAVKQRIMKN